MKVSLTPCLDRKFFFLLLHYDPLSFHKSETTHSELEATRNAMIEDKRKMIVKEYLAGLFLYWYGNRKVIRQILRPDWKGNPTESDRLCLSAGLSMVDMEDMWRNRWFTKRTHTALVDREMKESFGWMLVQDDAYLQTFRPTRLWEKLAMIILFDQIPRNVFRGQPNAYAYDYVALKFAAGIAETPQLHANLAFCFQATICIGLCHAERFETQDLLSRCINQQVNSDLLKNHFLWHALRKIATHHRERIEWFGRFPERNAILGRISTSEELT